METELINITAQISTELRKTLDEFAEKNDLSRSDIIRMALKKFLYDGHGDLFVR